MAGGEGALPAEAEQHGEHRALVDPVYTWIGAGRISADFAFAFAGLALGQPGREPVRIARAAVRGSLPPPDVSTGPDGGLRYDVAIDRLSLPADPPLLPPGTRLRSQGLWVVKKAECSVDEPMANSSILALPIVTAPQLFSLSTTVAS